MLIGLRREMVFIKYIESSVKLKNQLKVYFKQAFDLFLDLPQALTTNVKEAEK